MKLFRTLTALLLIAGACFTFTPESAAQGIPAPSIAFLGQIGCSGAGGSHRMGAIFYAPCYATYQAQILSGNSASGSQTIIVFDAAGGQGGVPLADGSTLPLAVFFNTNTPITINDNNAETVTPSSVSLGPCPSGFIGVGNVVQCAFVTATFSNTHGGSALVYSGDSGIEEAITDAGNQGGGDVYWQVDTGIVVLSTGGLTTTTSTKVPTTYYAGGASARVTTTITTSANWSVGVSGATASFCASNATLTAGTTCTQAAPALVGTGSTALTALLFTMGTSNPGAGALKSRVWGYTPVSAQQ